MGRMLGSFDPEDELDRPDLNKCPRLRVLFCYRQLSPVWQSLSAGNAGGRACRAEKAEETACRERQGAVCSVVPHVVVHSAHDVLDAARRHYPVPDQPLPRTLEGAVLHGRRGAYMVFVYFGLGSRLLAYLTEKPLVNTKLTEAQYRRLV